MIYKDPRAHNYYTNENGRSATNCPIDVRRIWAWLRNPASGRANGGQVSSDPESIHRDAVRPYFGEDLVME